MHDDPRNFSFFTPWRQAESTTLASAARVVEDEVGRLRAVGEYSAHSGDRAHPANIWNNGNNYMIRRIAGAYGLAWPAGAIRPLSWGGQTLFCVCPQSLVTC